MRMEAEGKKTKKWNVQEETSPRNINSGSDIGYHTKES